MTYAQRMKRAAAVSMLVHAALLATPWSARSARESWGPQPRPAPVVLNLQPPQAIRQLADVHTPAETPVQPTNLIAEHDAQAMDDTLRDGDTLGPKVDVEDPFDTLAARPAAPQASPAPAPDPVPPETPEPPKEESKAAKPLPDLSPEPQPEAPLRVADARMPKPALPPQPPVPLDMVPPSPEADRPDAETPSPLDEASRSTKGRLRNQVNRQGLAGFEAMQDQIAPYLREVRRRVERRWNVALLTRYSGTSPTEAVIDCAIAPDGSLLFARIVGAPRDRVFAALCQAALEQAAPFGPFPFEVPDLYREKNLEIRWTFSFL